METYRSSLRTTLCSVVLLSAAGGVGPAWGQDEDGPSNLERIQQLEVDSLEAGLWVYYSQGYEERAVAIGRQIAASNTFHRDSLGVNADIRVALLDPSDFERAAFEPGYPYGLPFISDEVTVLPADLKSGAVIEMYAPFETTASADVLADLQEIGLSYEDAKRQMVDLIGLHEIGHAQVYAFGLDARQHWFNEFLATYFAYAYMRSREPEMAVVWDAVTRAGREGYEPTHSSLDDLNRLYAGVGVGDYVWYQNIFQERIRTVYDEQGLDFLRQVLDRLSNPQWAPELSAELLAALEEIAPGFIAWAEAYEQ